MKREEGNIGLAERGRYSGHLLYYLQSIKNQILLRVARGPSIGLAHAEPVRDAHNPIPHNRLPISAHAERIGKYHSMYVDSLPYGSLREVIEYGFHHSQGCAYFDWHHATRH